MHRTKLLFSTRDYPIRNLNVLKCGATQIRNLFYLLDHGTVYDHPKKIHQINDDFARASDFGLTSADIAKEEHAFVALRHPTHRLLSLYFDKVLGSGQLARIRNHLKRVPDVDLNTDTLVGHLKNCIALLDLLERVMRDKTIIPQNPHWQMQTLRLGVIKDCRLKVVLVEDLNTHLEVLLKDIVPDIHEKLGQLTDRNASKKLVNPADLMSEALIDRVAEVYPRDQEMYDRAVAIWAGIDVKTATAKDIPRLFD